MHLRMAVGSLHGETILPSSNSLPDPSTQPQNDSAVGASHFDRMESELKALQQQAQATQQSLKQLQTREAVDPLTAIHSDLSAVAGDATVMSATGLVLLALAMVWWYLWHRPQTTPPEAELTVMPDKEVEPVAAAALAPRRAPIEHPADPLPSNPFAQREPNMGFDPEAAASEVMRVRKSLADKREARSLTLEREEMPSLEEWQARQELPPLEFDLELEPEPEHDEPISFSLPTPPPASAPTPAPQPETDPVTASAGAPPMTFATEPTPEPEPEPERVAEPAPAPAKAPDPSEEYDYAITLALAEESEALELWTEARELANEVLQSSDPALRSQAQALLDRLHPLENTTHQEPH